MKITHGTKKSTNKEHDELTLDAALEHFSWSFHLKDEILFNKEFKLEQMVLTQEHYDNISTKCKSGFKKINGLYIKKDVYGESDLILIPNSKKYGYVIETKTHYNPNSLKRIYYQLLKGEQFIKQEYGIDRVFKFLLYKKKKNSVIEYVR